MTNHERAIFSDWFDVLAVTHRLQVRSEDMRSQMKNEYFAVLESYPLGAVEVAYQSLRRKMKKWPVPADWLEALPPVNSAERLLPMSEAEVTESDEAERLGYEREEVCKCEFCVAANLVMPPRFVPRQTPDGNVIERRHPHRSQPVILGRWIHGAELRRWYAARAEFYLKLQSIPNTPMSGTTKAERRMTKIGDITPPIPPETQV